MPKDYFSEEIGAVPQKDYFSEEIGTLPEKTGLQQKFQQMKSGVSELTDLASNSVVKTATGKGFQDRALESAAPVIPPATERPFDSNVEKARNPIVQGNQIMNATAAGSLGSVADMATSPLGLAVPAEKAVASGVKMAGDAASNTARYFSRIKNTFKPKAIQNLNVSNSERIGNLARRSKEEASSNIEPLQKDIESIKQVQKNAINSANESRSVLKKNIASLHVDLQKSAESGALDFQKKLPDFFHANSEAYGTARDHAFTQMASEGKGITHQEVYSAIQKAKQDIHEALIPPDAPAIKTINMLEKKYHPTVETTPGAIVDASGNPLTQNVTSRADEFVNLDQLVQDLRNVKKNLSSGAASGRTGFNQEDLAVAFLDDSLGNYIKAKIPAFAQLQKDYSPVIRAMKEAHRVFKPNQGEFNTLNATNFLKKAGTGKLEAGQEKMLAALEGGNKFSPGVGNISQEVKTIGSNIDKIKNQIMKFEDQKKLITGASEQEISKKSLAIDSKKKFLQKRLNHLENRRQKITRLEANKNIVSKLKNAILGKVSEHAGLGAVTKIIR